MDEKINLLCSQVCFYRLGGNGLTLTGCDRALRASLEEKKKKTLCRRLLCELSILFDSTLLDVQ